MTSKANPFPRAPLPHEKAADSEWQHLTELLRWVGKAIETYSAAGKPASRDGKFCKLCTGTTIRPSQCRHKEIWAQCQD